MAKKRPSRKPGGRPRSGVGVERARGGPGWTLTYPECVREGAEDLDEVREMIASGEQDVAIDELRWLLGTCAEWIEAHYLLGKLAVEAQGDVSLGRAHFGFGYQLGARAIERAGKPTPVPAMHPANRPWYDAGRGLAWCLAELGKREMALEVVENLLRCDPSDPLNLREWVDEIKTAGAPIVELGGLFVLPKEEDRK
jgi:tetratricopeptide (TPR) repeat protein